MLRMHGLICCMCTCQRWCAEQYANSHMMQIADVGLAQMVETGAEQDDMLAWT